MQDIFGLHLAFTPIRGRVRCVRGAIASLTAVLLLFGGSGAGASAQYPSPYNLELGRGLLVTGTGLASEGIGLYYSSRLRALTEEQALAFDRGDVWAFDRLATRKRNHVALVISDVTGYGATVLPASLLASDRVRDNGGQAALLYGQVLLLNTGVTQLVKNTVRRPRPYTYNPDVALSRKLVKDARRSFFSGHTSNAAANSFFTAQLYHDYYPARRGDGWVWASAALLPAITGTTRVLSGNHYWTDVLVGYAVGAGIGVLVPTLYRL